MLKGKSVAGRDDTTRPAALRAVRGGLAQACRSPAAGRSGAGCFVISAAMGYMIAEADGWCPPNQCDRRQVESDFVGKAEFFPGIAALPINARNLIAGGVDHQIQHQRRKLQVVLFFLGTVGILCAGRTNLDDYQRTVVIRILFSCGITHDHAVREIAVFFIQTLRFQIGVTGRNIAARKQPPQDQIDITLDKIVVGCSAGHEKQLAADQFVASAFGPRCHPGDVIVETQRLASGFQHRLILCRVLFIFGDHR
jgi:hypothetical protein